MIAVERVTDYQSCVFPWVFDRIEVKGSVFVGPAPGTYHRADFDRAREPVHFSLLGTWHCEFQSGPHLGALADYCGQIAGAGFYGLASARRVNP